MKFLTCFFLRWNWTAECCAVIPALQNGHQWVQGLFTVCFCWGTLSPETSSSFLSCCLTPWKPLSGRSVFSLGWDLSLLESRRLGVLFGFCCLGICLVAFPVCEELFSWELWGTLLQPCPPAAPQPCAYKPWMCASFQASPAACRHPAFSSHPEIVSTTHSHILYTPALCPSWCAAALVGH